MILGEFQHNIVVVDVDMKQKKRTEWKPEGNKRTVAKLRHESCRQLFECRIKEFMFGNNDDLWGCFKEDVLKACDEVCGYKKNRNCNVNT